MLYFNWKQNSAFPRYMKNLAFSECLRFQTSILKKSNKKLRELVTISLI